MPKVNGEWEKVSGDCPRCLEDGQLYALVFRFKDGEELIEGERCGMCGWILNYADLDVTIYSGCLVELIHEPAA